MTKKINGGSDSLRVPAALKTELEQFFANSHDNGDSINNEPYEAVAGYIQETLAERGKGHREIDTWSGEKIRPLDPNPEKIHVEDVAHGLSNVGRFAGQGQEFYSVARHSVHVSLEVEARGGDKAAQRYALVHDAAEAYLSDVPGPVKKSLPGYKHAERRLDAAVVTAFGLEVDADTEAAVKAADKVVGMHELATQFPNGGHKEADLHHDPSVVEGNADKTAFLERANHLHI
ncbi:hypothetical protein ACLI4Q_03890 [Natrialbaceae archaeon A-CW1-1]